MSKLIDISRQRFGYWVVSEKCVLIDHTAFWECTCDCGTVKLVTSQSLRNGTSVSCGCFRPDRLHGMKLEEGLYGIKMLPKEAIRKRYEEKVIKTPNCWAWVAAKTKDGYGVMSVSFGRPTRLTKAHRISWFLRYGWWAGGDLDVCHKCNTPECSNPTHLYVAVQKINSQHARRDGLISSNAGYRNGSNCRLTEDQVRYLRSITKRGALQVAAEECGVSLGHAYHIRYGHKWKHLT